VDLNLQFPAGWEQAQQIKFAQGFTSPAPRDFVGFGPITEPEALTIYNFTLQYNFNLILAYHSQGQVIYWQFQNFSPPKAEFIGNQFSKVSGYSLEDTPYNSSFAGYKDWFIQNYNKPGYTIEVGTGNNPLPISQFDKIYQDNLGILILGAILA
jgi:g-D-glutamyl-meso-diaminopimelate peptidase